MLRDSGPELGGGADAGTEGLLVLEILFLFLSLYTISNQHSTVALRHIARSLRMPADLAGMTLLAFGNGSPDFFTAVFGAKQAPEMILAGSVGAALFTFTIVFGLVILLQSPPPSASPSTKLDPALFLKNVLLCIFCSLALLLLLSLPTIPFWIPAILLLLYTLNISASILAHVLCAPPTPPSSENGQHEPHAKTSQAVGEEYARFWRLGLWERLLYLCRNHRRARGGSAVVRALCAALDLANLPISLVLHLSLLPMRLPDQEQDAPARQVALAVLNRLRLLTAPSLSLLLLVHVLGLPVWRAPYHWLLVAAALSSAASAALWTGSAWDRPPRCFVLHAVYAFLTCLAFVYLISRQLIPCLRSLGALLGVSPSTMGILVLAWGNSFGDLISDTSMARNGALDTAVFGVFSAHIQNVLFTLGTAFLIAALGSPDQQIALGRIGSEVFVGLAVVATVLLLSLTIVPLLFRFTIPKHAGIVLLALYAAFACIALFLELRPAISAAAD